MCPAAAVGSDQPGVFDQNKGFGLGLDARVRSPDLINRMTYRVHLPWPGLAHSRSPAIVLLL